MGDIPIFSRHRRTLPLFRIVFFIMSLIDVSIKVLGNDAPVFVGSFDRVSRVISRVKCQCVRRDGVT